MFTKKKLLWTCLLTLSILFTSCVSNKVPLPNKTRSEDHAVEEVPPPLSTQLTSHLPTEVMRDSQVSYRIDSKINKKQNIKIVYPRISGLKDTGLQEKVNNTLKNEAFKLLNYYDYEEAGDDLYFELSYTAIYQSSKLLSVQYNVYGHVMGTAHPNNLFGTVNINLITGERIQLADILSVNASFVEMLRDGIFQPTVEAKPEYNGNDLVFKDKTDEEIMNDLKVCDETDLIGTGEFSDMFCYFTKEKFGISVGVSHSMCDHIEFEAPYGALKENRKQNDVWDNLTEVK